MAHGRHMYAYHADATQTMANAARLPAGLAGSDFLGGGARPPPRAPPPPRPPVVVPKFEKCVSAHPNAASVDDVRW